MFANLSWPRAGIHHRLPTGAQWGRAAKLLLETSRQTAALLIFPILRWWSCRVDVGFCNSAVLWNSKPDENRSRKSSANCSRRDKFRLNAGPSKEALAWSKIVAVLQKITVSEFSASPRDPGKSQGKSQSGDWKGSGTFRTCREQNALSNAENAELPCRRGLPSYAECHDTKADGIQGRELVTLDACNLPGSNKDQTHFPTESAIQLNILENLERIFSVVENTFSFQTFKCPWEEIPDSADPVRGSGYKPPKGIDRTRHEGDDKNGNRLSSEHRTGRNGNRSSEHHTGLMERGERKRLQVESIAAVLKSFQLKPGSKVVDFGCGSGALTLPLAVVFPQLTFIGVDFKRQSVALLKKRAERANLKNVAAFHSRIETFSETFDACVALHACGIATDLALLQAIKQGAAYAMSPCCVGKLRLPFQDVMLNSARHMHLEFLPRFSHSLNLDHHDSTLPESHQSVENVDGNKSPKSEEILLQGFGKQQPEAKTFASSPLSYPRSRWLRSCASTSDFHFLARAADWSSYDHEDIVSRLRRLCKVVVELDRNEASRESGFCTGLFLLSDPRAGTVGVSHVLVGEPHFKEKI